MSWAAGLFLWRRSDGASLWAAVHANTSALYATNFVQETCGTALFVIIISQTMVLLVSSMAQWRIEAAAFHVGQNHPRRSCLAGRVENTCSCVVGQGG